MVDWDRIKKDYVEGRGTQRELASRYGVNRSALGMRAAREDWTGQRMALLQKISATSQNKSICQSIPAATTAELSRMAHSKKLARMETVSDKLLTRISQAIDELNVQVLREVRKEKELIYDHPQRTDKATREILVERETLTKVKAPVDRNGIKLLAAALKDIRDVQMLRDPTDLREQEAKIAKLEKEVNEDPEKDSSSLTVTFALDAESCSE